MDACRPRAGGAHACVCLSLVNRCPDLVRDESPFTQAGVLPWTATRTNSKLQGLELCRSDSEQVLTSVAQGGRRSIS